MIRLNLFEKGALALALIFPLAPKVWAQQQDVPEPVFQKFSIQAPYIPTYHGRDPFKPLEWLSQTKDVSIVELEYHGIIYMNGTPMALFESRNQESVRFTLKNGKLYNDADIPVDGVVGSIHKDEVALIQDGQKIVYPRNR
jgi:hypothetical protein